MFTKILEGLGCFRDPDTGLWSGPRNPLAFVVVLYDEDWLDNPSLFGTILANVHEVLLSIGLDYNSIHSRPGSIAYVGLGYRPETVACLKKAA